MQSNIYASFMSQVFFLYISYLNNVQNVFL